MEVAPSNGSSSNSSDFSVAPEGSDGRNSSSRVLSPQFLANPVAAPAPPPMAYKQWQYPAYPTHQDTAAREPAPPVYYYCPPLQPHSNSLPNGYQQPYYYVNTPPTQQQQQQQQQQQAHLPGPKLYQYPGFQEQQPAQHQQLPPSQHPQSSQSKSPTLNAQQYPPRQFSASPVAYQVTTPAITPLGYMAPQQSTGYDSSLLSPPSTSSSLARRPMATSKPARRPIKQKDSIDLPHELQVQSFDVTTAHGQSTRPRVTTTMWEDEKTLCYQVEANGVSVVRRADNDMINGTKLLNVAKITRGRRDGILKAERIRHVVKIGSMHLKGVWIPFERAHAMAQREKIVDYLYPLFVKEIQSVLKQTSLDFVEPPPPPQPQPQPPSQPQPQSQQQITQEEDLVKPQLSYDLAPAWYNNMPSRSHTSPQPYRTPLSYGQYQNIASSSNTPPPNFPLPLQPAYHQAIPSTSYHSEFPTLHRPQHISSAASNSTAGSAASSSIGSGSSNSAADSILNPPLNGQETLTNGPNPKSNTPGKLLTGIQPPQPIGGTPGTRGSVENSQDESCKKKDV